MKFLSITVGWPHPDLSPNGRAHFMAKSRAAKAAKEEANWAARAALGRNSFTPGADKVPVHLLANPPKGWRTGDDDNLIARCKSHLDGIAAGLGLNDRCFKVTGVTWGERSDKPTVTIEVEAA